MAQTDLFGSRQATIPTVPDVVDRVLTNQSKNHFENRTILRQVDGIFGLGAIVHGTFPENEIAEDARAFNVLYRDLLKQQVSTTPLIRTPDLNSPFNSSLLTAPSATSRIVGSELVYERATLR
ncbi:MAG: hypothetical protein SFW36_01615 [Leptolyngbyaceae cyanobacterium bins.59]|nr:hypothetical protein [Leptolyngbyaceae cyanobacterium bins.59]